MVSLLDSIQLLASLFAKEQLNVMKQLLQFHSRGCIKFAFLIYLLRCGSLGQNHSLVVRANDSCSLLS